MGRNVKGTRAAAADSVRPKRQVPSSEDKESVKLSTTKQSRSVLGDQTNTKSPSHTRALRQRGSSTEETEPPSPALSTRSTRSQTSSKARRAISLSGEPSNKEPKAKQTVAVEILGKRVARKRSLKENDDEDEGKKTPVKKRAVATRPGRFTKQELSSLLEESSGGESSSSEEEQPVLKAAISKPAGRRNTATKKSKPPVQKKQEAHVCVYKAASAVPAKPPSPTNRETKGLELYEFGLEEDEEEEPRGKKGPRQRAAARATKARPRGKQLVTRKKPKPAPSPRAKNADAKSTPSPCASVNAKSTTASHAKAGNTSATHSNLKQTPASKTAVNGANLTPSKITRSAAAGSAVKNVPSVNKSASSNVVHHSPVSTASSFSENVEPPLYLPSPERSSIHEPTLEELFDDDEDGNNVAFVPPPVQKPTRFEYAELAQARAKVQQNRIVPRVIPSAAAPLPADPEVPSGGSRLRQTTLRAFLKSNINPQEEAAGGLFDLKPSEDCPVSSTPCRPARNAVQPPSCILSPVLKKVQSDTSQMRRSPRKTPQKSMTTPQDVQMDVSAQPSLTSPAKCTPPASPHSSPCRMSPRKVATTPLKVNPSPLKRSLKKHDNKEKKVADKELPTRLSLNSLKMALKANRVAPAIPEEPLLDPEWSPSKEEQHPADPASPKRTFHKPPRKSYENRRARPAPNFMELESESEPEDPSEPEDEPLGDARPTRKQNKTRRPKPQGQEDGNDFDVWAEKFNSQLEQLDDFDLEVE